MKVKTALFLVVFMLFSTGYSEPSTQKKPRQIWAQSYLFRDSPAMEFEEWLTEKPDMKGKFVILEFWRTWCGACKKVTPVFNRFQKKFADDLVIIAVTGESKDVVASYNGPKKEYYMAVDKEQEIVEEEGFVGGCGSGDESFGGCGEPPANDVMEGQGVTEAAYGVHGWPHVVILEPEERVVVWEGFPLQEGYELTEEKILKYIDVYRKGIED